jgi:thiosulfate reductase cytochrome b subunit
LRKLGPEEFRLQVRLPQTLLSITSELDKARCGAGVMRSGRRNDIPLSLLTHSRADSWICASWYHSRVGDSARIPSDLSAVPTTTVPSRHSALVRITHWITTLCFLALLVSGGEIVISHPRFYWGETGNDLTPTLFKLPIPASRALVPTGYGYVLPDQNGWSRYLHFQAAWVVVLTGLLYIIFGLVTAHFQRDLFPGNADLSWRSFSKEVVSHLRFQRPSEAEAWSYNALQRLSYLFVIFVLFPFVIWTGLAMSPAFVSAVPAAVNVLGGQQSARTLHFFVSLALVLFLLVHVGMVWLAGFRDRMRAMITGRAGIPGAGTTMERT